MQITIKNLNQYFDSVRDQEIQLPLSQEAALLRLAERQAGREEELAQARQQAAQAQEQAEDLTQDLALSHQQVAALKEVRTFYTAIRCQKHATIAQQSKPKPSTQVQTIKALIQSHQFALLNCKPEPSHSQCFHLYQCSPVAKVQSPWRYQEKPVQLVTPTPCSHLPCLTVC